MTVAPAPVIALRGVSKAFGAAPLLVNVDVSIAEGERVGLVGVNGSGKSTLCRVLCELEASDQGQIQRRRGARIAYLEQAPTFEPGVSARDVVRLGLGEWNRVRDQHERVSRALAQGHGDSTGLLLEQESLAAEIERLGGWSRDHEIDELLTHLSVPDPDARVETLSGGERRRVALARLLALRPDLAILDEPTNHLDVETIEWLEGHLIDEQGGALLLVTHDRYLLDRVATRTLELDRGHITAYDGGYELYLEGKAERLAQQARTEANRQNFLRRELEWLRRMPKARSTKQKARIERAEAAIAAPPPPRERVMEASATALRSGKIVLELDHLTLELGGRTLVRDLSLHVLAGERLGIVGRNGAGKTTLLSAITGRLPPASGAVRPGASTRVAYFDQERSGLDLDASVFENVAGDQSRFEVAGKVVEARSWLERFSFDSQAQRQPVGSLSGGERARVALAKLLRQGANLLVFDEPTNDLDVATLGALEALLVEFEGTALVVTHDRWFLDRVATGILHFEGDGRVVRYPGNHDTFLRLKREREAAERDALAAQPPAPPQRGVTEAPATARRGLSFKERQEYEGLEQRVEQADRRVRELEAELADPALYTRGPDAFRTRSSELADARAESERLTARWLELEERREG